MLETATRATRSEKFERSFWSSYSLFLSLFLSLKLFLHKIGRVLILENEGTAGLLEK